MPKNDQHLFDELPLLPYTQLRTSDREVALAAAEAAISPMSVAFGSSSGQFQYELRATEMGRTKFISHEQRIDGGAHFEVEPNGSDHMIEIPIRGRSRVRHGDELDVVAGRDGVIMSPSNSTNWDDDGLLYQAVSIHFDSDLLRTRLAVLTGVESRTDITFHPHLDLQSGAGRRFFSLLASAYNHLDEDNSIFANKYSAALYEELLINVLLTEFAHSHSSSLENPVYLTANRAVRKAEEYFEEHADKPISISDVAIAVGASVRSLQRTFQKINGTSPMRYLRNLRLDRARMRLINSGLNANITQIAIMSGFGHLGNFAAEYKRRFGESPSETARRIT